MNVVDAARAVVERWRADGEHSNTLTRTPEWEALVRAANAGDSAIRDRLANLAHAAGVASAVLSEALIAEQEAARMEVRM